MNIPVDKDELYELFQEPTREKLRELLNKSTGESNHLDFKAKCPQKDKLAKLVLAMANSGGGIVFIGAKEIENSTHLEYPGLAGDDIRDHTEIGHDLEKYVPNILQYNIRDYAFESSEYPVLKGKTFQVIYVQSNPLHLPYICMAEGPDVKKGNIYIRRNTANELINMEELKFLIDARLDAERSQASNLELSEHLDQLRILCKYAPPSNGSSSIRDSLLHNVLLNFSAFQNNNMFYEIIEGMIEGKKKLIMRCLGI